MSVSTVNRRVVTGAVRARFEDGRWHFQHGPIDLIIRVDGSPQACRRAIDAAWHRFESVLAELCAELPLLRSNGVPASRFNSPIARRMASACWPFHQQYGLFITPMAAVAGSVAEEILACIEQSGVRRASVNNGGDIALLVRDDSSFSIGMIADTAQLQAGLPSAMPPVAARIEIDQQSGVRGIATSGWRGRSLSLGIADAVTVLAGTAAAADAAATMIANAVNVEHPGIVRLPANQIRDDSDLLSMRVTRSVSALPPAAIDLALDRGLEFADRLVQARLIDSAFLMLQGNHRVAGVTRVFGEKYGSSNQKISGDHRRNPS